MEMIKEKSAGILWQKACLLVMNKGHEVKDNEQNLKEIIDLYIEVENASEHDDLIKKYSDPEMIKWMMNDNFGGDKPVLNWGYCYGMRLYDYDGVNQIGKIIEKLKKNPESKSSTIVTMKPSADFDGHMPCIVVIDFKIRNNKLLLTSFFRSQDIGKKIYADIFSLGKIQNDISQALNVDCGPVKIFISSAHVYESDFEAVNKLIGSQ
jgi:thymidylate synthase